MEVKEGPDRVEYVERSQESLSRLKESLPSLENYEIVGIYASLDMRDFTTIQLNNRGIYALIIQADMFEIPNSISFGKVKKLKRWSSTSF
ncbi:MAG: hypothetical protein N2Z58_02215 [Fervidobacterium sp.]|nr:hypothetical protein [Fervidobacterium sp.]